MSAAIQNHFDLVILGAGAAGLTAAIFAGEAAQGCSLHIALLDGAKKPGAKILVSGGGRCNVTNERVTPDDFWGGPRTVIRNVLRAFDHRRTLTWMQNLGVELKLEPTGKYFPVTDKARTVLDALLTRVRSFGIKELYGQRIKSIRRLDCGYLLEGDEEAFTTRKLIIATGGRSLPKSGSDGWGLEAVRRLGHTIVPTTPALAPLVLTANGYAGGRFADLSGLTMPLRIGLYSQTGKALTELSDSLLFTHFGLSGPAALNFSRHWLRCEESGKAAALGHPDFRSAQDADEWLLREAQSHPKRAVETALQAIFPERLARLIAGEGGMMGTLPKQQRRAIAGMMARLPIAIEGARGWSFAETTAGGVELREIDPRTMVSRVADDLYLCGEMLDVDGRIGGFNFQWAWASGYLAGRAAVRSLVEMGGAS